MKTVVKRKGEKTKGVMVRLTPEMKEKLDRRLSKENTTIQSLLETMLLNYLDR